MGIEGVFVTFFLKKIRELTEKLAKDREELRKKMERDNEEVSK